MIQSVGTGNGISSSSSLASSTYDVVLMDNQMPIMDGPTAAREMRALGFKGLIIGVTGNALIADIDQYIASGADKVLPKPIDVFALESILKGTFYLR